MNKRQEVTRSKTKRSAETLDIALDQIVFSEHFRIRPSRMEAVVEIAASIQRIGQANPLFVRPYGERYELIDGYRRYGALRLLDAPLAYCRIFRDISDEDALRLAASENRSVDALKDLEAACAYAEKRKKSN
jgi:ParB/RepB/Spo0J family partition protein